MATDNIYTRRRIRAEVVLWLLWLMMCLTAAMARKTQLQPGDASFTFTQPHYNVSIMENSGGKTYLTPSTKMGMYITDPTLDIRYRIHQGDDNKLFKVEERTVGDFCFLRLRTRSGIHKVINREREAEYLLTVKAVARYRNGPSLTATAEVLVTVLDANDLSPLFYPIRYNVAVLEDTPVHKPIVTVIAEDADIGVNGEVYYSFKEPTETFAIHPTSGEVTLTRKVSYIEQNYYKLTILAEDRGPQVGHGSRISRAELEVLIREVNHYAPRMDLQELPAVSEQGIVGTIYAMLYVHDNDYGDNGKIGSVSITEGNEENYFQLQKGGRDSEYTIQVARTVDRELTPNGFNLTIQAQDMGSPVRTSTLTVHVRLGDVNDQTPQFEKSSYQVSVDEVVPVNTPLLFVRARDGDLGKNAEVVYSISGGNDNGWFAIDQWSGLISVAAPLDAETHKVVSLEVSATDRANLGSRRSSQTRVLLNIRDCNDNAPIFNHTTRMIGISESRPVGTEVYTVSAFDLDEGDNGFISYSIVNEEDTPFSINHFTGQITTKAVLDYESMRRVYRLRVRASDWGEPYRRESEMIYEVKIKDVNDNKPKFEKDNCMGYLSRGAAHNTMLVVVSAIDFDAGNIISYQIIGGNDDRCFDIEPSTGVVRLKCDLRGHTENFRSLLITASDGKNIADSTTVNITLVNNNRNRQLANNDVDINCRPTDVTDRLSKLLSRQDENSDDWNSWVELASRFSENTHSPRFLPTNPGRVQVEEGLAPGHKVLMLNAEDPDHGYNGKLLYVISNGNAGGSFKMDTYSGDLLVMSDIDRETQILYVLNISVFDMGIPSRSASITLQVEITDVNDYPPQFDKPSYLVSIPENIMVNRTILQVRAVDYDEGINARISYSILTDTEDFVISPDTGIVTVNRELDRETNEKYELIIQAKDGSADFPLSSTATATVLIDDINDNAPKFLPENYVVRVREDLPKGTVVMILTAHDPDMAGGGTVRYHLTEGMDDKFDIDRTTGTIRITNKLDFERQQMFNITAKARDRGDPPLSSHCNIVVEVIDVNENLYAPRFADFVFQGKVSENQPVNTSVMQITANDDDEPNPLASPKDYEVVYSVQGGSGQGIFMIDQNGMLWTNRVLDRESHSHYWLTIVARDRGTVPQSSRVEVLIEVQDLNDNVPQTEEPVYYPTVVESSPEGTSVVRVEGYDLDATSSNKLTYDITSGNPQGFFVIDSVTGLITTTKRLLDREKQDEHILEVTVQDNGSPPQSSTTRVVVTVADLNDEEPEFMERMYRVRIPEASAAPAAGMRPLYRVLAHDRDMGANADIDYSIKSGRGNGRFRINAKTGTILSDKDFTAGSQYDLTIKAVDNGRPQRRQSTRVIFTVVACPNSTVAPPRFRRTGVSAEVMESDSVGHMVAIISAEDEAGKIWYSITGGNEEDKFSIDNENGNIIVAGSLDWEARREYNLTVEATNCIHRVSTWVHISVLDINDNRPKFTASTYEVNFGENTERGVSVLQVAATDRDEDSRLFYTIHSVTDLASRNKFTINSQTGVITTLEALNREAISRHELVIMVRDQGTPSKRNLARVIIHVQDHNDHAPRFLTSNFEGRVFETVSVGTAVLQVLATDQDTGINAQIKYTILTGNVGSAFTIDPVMGHLTVAKPLDRSRQSEYRLVVRASDGGSPSLTTNTNVHITVTMADNAPPRFDHNEYTTEIAENKPAGEFVAVVSAISKSSVIFEIIDGDNLKMFRVNPNSGVVSTTQVLDYEENTFFNLTIRANNMVDASALCTLLVHVIDQNDNRPVFTQDKYVGTVSEAAVVGSVILQADNAPLVVKAIDADTNLNALLVYSILEPLAQEKFTIDTNTGAIRTNCELDHESSPNHTFTVQVTDLGKPQQSAQVAAKVVINVEDINDSPPEFSEAMYEARLMLPTYRDVVVVTVTAHDRDSGVNSTLVYSISGGDEEHFFKIDPHRGTIVVRNPQGLRHSYELTVSVSDGTFENIGMVKISVELTEAAGLHFSQAVYEAEISENRTGVEEVTVITAVGHALNEHLTFSILNPTQMFRVGVTSGVVQTLGVPFDRETQENYTLVVEVTDQRNPPRIAHALLKVHVRDENDNRPMFINQPYYAVASIDARRGDIVKQVTAIDLDDGLNGEVEYSLTGGDTEDSRFRIHRKTGEIIIKRPLEAGDQNREYVLRVIASDKGVPSLWSEVLVPIKIMNKATPVFDEPYYEVSILENVPMHTAILTVEAKSPTNQKLIYSISNGDVYSEFAVDFNTGAITVIDHLDYELWQKYELTLRATDTKTGSYAEAIIHVYLEDVNDQAPSFESLLYVETISEAVGIGTSILAVSATDKDSGRNAELVYRIEPAQLGSNDSSHFHIDPVKGIILTKQKLNHELKDKLTFQVTATDHGVPSMSTSVRVTVIILDFNDNPPRFEQPTYDVTITDLVKRGQFVTMVTASDADSSNAGSLLYSIVGGNEKQAFVIDESKGVVSLSSLRKPVLEPFYTLNVSVTDGVFTNFARLRITVRNSNNHIPVFGRLKYDVDIAENLTPEQKVVTVVASDDDLGPYGHMTYSIGSEDAQETFRIDAETGDVYTRLHLDREETNVYEVPIVATDGGGRSGHAFLHINVGDRSDNRPQFKMNEYKANIYSSAANNAFVLQVSATDKDLGSNAAVQYSFVPSGGGNEAAEYFTIDTNSGVIRVQKSINAMESSVFQFFVRAADQGSPPKENRIPVEIYVMSAIDQPPSFDQEVYTYFIPEDRPVDSIIATVAVTTNSSVVYRIVPGSLPYTNVPPVFGINGAGKVSVVAPLDREITETFELTIKAETEATPALVAYTHVTVQIMDVNDNKPQFESNPYQISVAENAQVGAKVIQVIAHDQDAGVNADVSYEFALEDTAVSNVFAIDPSTGWITTLVGLNREDMAEYSFNVIATDRGIKDRLRDVTAVHVTVLDHNDEPPVFSSSLYKGAVNEDALPGTIILTVTTTDRDLEENAQVRYYITDGNPLGQFNIRNTGEVYVNKALDREATPFYELTVSATDGAFVSEAKLSVTVLDANDNTPVCEQPMYIASVSENVPIGSFVLTVAATDADEQGTRNARIEYRIDGEGASTFAMHRRTGIITTRRNLDRERVSEYRLTVDARDGGGRTCSMEAFLTVTDINDNEPVFSQPYYTVSIAEDAEINTLITRVSAVDRDLGINRKVRYAMKESNGHFVIDQVSGIVSLTRNLDREEKDRFNLTLYAYDQGNPKMTSISYLIVRLLDVNDNPPEFEHHMYSHNVREDTHVGMSLMRVFATSRDTGVNAEITYSITGGNEHGKFRVDSKTGAIAVIQPLDYESAREYVLTVQATDGGTPPLSSTAVVRFNVTDANDNAPIFTQPSYEASVREDAQSQHNVIQVVAMDADSATNGQLTYMIIGGDTKNVFTINRRDGFISVTGALDRETVPSYTLDVQAVDSGHPRLTGVVAVTIEILDANDNAPQFTLDNYTAVVQEDKNIGYSVIQLSVTDNDIEPNAGPFSFDIIEGNQGGEFRIDRQLRLSTVARFDRQIKDVYELVVRVFDNGNPPLFSDTAITVRIIEESAFQPVITALQITVTASGDQFPGGVLGRIKAYDRDHYDRLRFAIASSDDHLFSIHSDDGTIQAIQSLDTGEYHINVSVTDGKFYTFSEVQLLIVGIEPAMGENAVVVRLGNVLPEEFIGSHKDAMSRVIEKELSVPSDNIFYLSVQPASNTVITPSRTRRSTDSDLDVLLAVRKTPESFYRGNALRRKLVQMGSQLEKRMDVKIKKIFNDVCEKNTCDEKICVTEVRFYPETILSILTEDKSYVTARHALEPRCKCRFGARGCDMLDACTPNPCRGPHVCKLEGQLGYKCDCPDGKTGENCQEDVPPTCTDPKCYEGKPLSFNGQSYAWWRLTDPNERRFILQLSVKTLQASTAALMFAVGRVDHSILEMVNGRLQYRFDCGSGEGLVRVDSMPVNDGNWHAISVERRGNSAEIVIDSQHKAQSTAPGTNDVLNLDSNAVYFGSEVLNPTKGFTDIHNSFKGCLRDIKINGVVLPYSGSNRVASIVKFENVEFHCKRAYIPGVCSSSPCFNGGTCIPKGVDKYMCHCHSRFVGGRCEVDTNPCASNPCKHAGICENGSNDYRCLCKSGLSGKQCQRGFYCRRPSNPCQNGGICTDGDSGPICNCQGFRGEFCEQDVDECLESPCLNGGTCLNIHGSFQCTCLPDTSGILCEETSFSSIKSTPFNITIEEIIGIAGVLVGLLIIVIIFVVVVRWRRRKRRQQLQQAGAASNRDDFFNCDDLKRSNKMKNIEIPANMVQNIPPTPRNINPSPRPSPRPPPVPNRPASYTPSTADSVNTLNNFDTVCNYGSAGDELENLGTLQHIEIPEFLQNLDIEKSPTHIRTLPPPPHGVRIEDGQQKAAWDYNNPNIAQNYPYDDRKKHHKTMPTGKHSAPAPTPTAGSISSLPVSEMDDDLQASAARGKKKGYHWDASDWAPNPSLPNITELPMKEVPDSPSTSSRSNESNIHIDPNDEYDFTDYHDDTDYVDGNESEYVGDSEYAENECGDDDDLDDMDDPSDFPDPPNFEHILAMHGDLAQPEDTGVATNYNLHPDQYLPTFHIESGASQDDWPDDGNGNADNMARDDDEDVIHYGFPRPKQPRFVSHEYPTPLDYNTDYEHSAMSAIDDMSVSMGGYTSTNASCSDISGLCEIEDSEVNMSDNDSDHERRPSKASHSHIHTQV